MTIPDSLIQTMDGFQASHAWQMTLHIAAWTLGSYISAELLGYWVYQLLNGGLRYGNGNSRR